MEAFVKMAYVLVGMGTRDLLVEIVSIRIVLCCQLGHKCCVLSKCVIYDTKSVLFPSLKDLLKQFSISFFPNTTRLNESSL